MKFRVDGILGITNIGGIEIMIDDDAETLLYRYNIGVGKPSRSKRAEIFYQINDDTNEHEACFTIKNENYYLSEFMKVGY